VSKIRYEDLEPMQCSPLNSCISTPKDGDEIHSGEQRYLDIKGYAIPDGETGNQVTKVEISFDEG